MTSPLILVCKPEFEDALAEEAAIRGPGLECATTGRGLVVFKAVPQSCMPVGAAPLPEPTSIGNAPAADPPSPEGTGTTGARPLSIVQSRTEESLLTPKLVEQSVTSILSSPLIFERQRIENALLLPVASLKATAREITRQLLPPIVASEKQWTTHAFAPCAQEDKNVSAHARNIERVFLEFCKERFTRAFRRYVEPEQLAPSASNFVLNLCVIPDGVWGAAMSGDRLSDSKPGGIHRMAFDNAAPCRSYLKIEEAFDVIGTRPSASQTVVDLGAAPGGWSYAFLKRGCRVTAVDNGPMRIADPRRNGGVLTHLQEDGVTYEPDPRDRPVDWLVSDMLISTGKNLGMLKSWFSNRWMLNFVVNIKLPQTHPYPVLKPFEDYLAGIRGIDFSIRQLYHDRSEVTLFGSLGR